jgi:long-subunit fatty acid transport protein
VVHDTDGWMTGVGVRYALDRHFALEAGLRHLHVRDVEARAVLTARSHRDGVFPMRSDVLHVGAAWGF